MTSLVSILLETSIALIIVISPCRIDLYLPFLSLPKRNCLSQNNRLHRRLPNLQELADRIDICRNTQNTGLSVKPPRTGPSIIFSNVLKSNVNTCPLNFEIKVILF
jgi:hypothetical protein